MLHYSHQAMGTLFEIILIDVDPIYAQQASQAVFAEIDRIERLLTRFNPGSDIGQINNLKSGQSCAVGVEAFECLGKALAIQNETRGAFAIHYASLLENQKIPSSIETPLKLSSSSGRFIVTVNKEWPLSKSKSPLVDLGGIGKGFALDKALDLLVDWDIPKALLHGGTSTALAFGNPPGRKGWDIGVASDWNCPSAPRKIVVKNRAVSGSGKEVKGEHIMDPRTGLPATGHKASWVSHPSAATADALSTAFVVMRTSEVEKFCCENKKTWAMVVLNNGQCQTFNQNIH